MYFIQILYIIIIQLDDTIKLVYDRVGIPDLLETTAIFSLCMAAYDLNATLSDSSDGMTDSIVLLLGRDFQ